MTTQSRFRNWFSRRANRPIRKPSGHFRPRLTGLENRCVPATFTVNNILDDGSTGSLRWAINQANAATEASTVQFDPGVFNTPTPQRISLNGSLRTSGDGQNSLYLTNTNFPISIVGPSEGVWVQGQTSISWHVNHVFWVYPGVTASIQNVTIASGFNESVINGGAGLHNEGTVNLTNCIFLGNLGLFGGAFENWGTATVSNSRFSGNQAYPSGIDNDGNGGAIFNRSGATITLNSTEISANSASADGSGLFNAGTAILNNCNIERNTAGDDGGGLFNSGQHASLTLNGGTISGNTSGGAGAGLYNDGGGVNLTGSTVSGNSANYDGGGLYTQNGFMYLTNCTISHNISASDGGGLSNDGYGYGQVGLDNCSVVNNVANSGAGILNRGTTTVNNSNVSGNTARENGGGIANYSGTLSVTSCTVSSNTANIANNYPGTDGLGGGIYNYATATVTNTAIFYNSAGFGGGGIYSDGTLTAINSTICYNATNDEGWGGGLYNHDVTNLVNCTINLNRAIGLGGGIFNDYTVNMTNTIVAGNQGDPGQPGYDILCGDYYISSQGYNLIGMTDGSGTTWANTDLVGTLQLPLDPLLGPLGNNGGLTDTMALKRGSPAIKKGTHISGITTDQRGFPLDSPPDIGAFQTQVQATPPPLPAFAVGAGPGGGPFVNVYDAAGTLIRVIQAYQSSFRGGVHVATADVNGDDFPDLITAPGFGGGPVIRIWDGETGTLQSEFNAYDPLFRGGVNIAAVRLFETSGPAQIITGAGPTGGPHVKVFKSQTQAELASFLAYDPSFTGGISVAATAASTGSPGQIFTGAGPGGGPHVQTFSATGAPQGPGFMAYDHSFRGGVNVAALQIGDIITAPASGGGPIVRSFDPSGVMNQEFLAYDAAFLGGVNLGVIPHGPNTSSAIWTGAGPGGGPHVKRFDATNFSVPLDSFMAFDLAFTGGVFVG